MRLHAGCIGHSGRVPAAARARTLTKGTVFLKAGYLPAYTHIITFPIPIPKSTISIAIHRSLGLKTTLIHG